MRPQSAKAKGRRFQQKVCKLLLQTFPTLRPDDVRSTSMGAGGEDVLLSPAAQAVFPYTIECKNCESLNIYAAFRQAASHAVKVRRAPVVFFSRNRCNDYVAVDGTLFTHLPKHTGAVWTLISDAKTPCRVTKNGTELAIMLASDWLLLQSPPSSTEVSAVSGANADFDDAAESTVNWLVPAATVPAAAPCLTSTSSVSSTVCPADNANARASEIIDI